MAQTLASGVVIPAPGDRISASGVQEMRTLGASVDTGLSLAQAQTAQTDLQSRARDADLADQVAGMEGMTYVGAWESGRVYRINDVVTHGGDSWARLTAGSAGEPGASPTDWGLVARKGDGGGFGELSETDVTGLYATVEPEPSVPVSWADLTGKPATYPPATHTHEITDVPGLQAIIDRLTYDSGWRDVRALLPAGLAVSTSSNGRAILKRRGDRLLIELHLDVSAAGITTVLPLPAGWRPDVKILTPYAYWTSSTTGSALPGNAANGYLGAGGVSLRSGSLPNPGTVLISLDLLISSAPPATFPGPLA